MPTVFSNRSQSRSKSEPHKRRITTPVVLQMHATECGAACLGSILGYFGRWVPLTELRDRCEVSRDGSSAASIKRAASHYGLECEGLSLQAEQLKKLDLPLILFWQFSHFVVLEGFSEHHFHINDPATGRRTISADEFAKQYSSIALQFSRNEDFQTGGELPNLFAQLKSVLDGSWNALGGVAVCGMLLAFLALVIPMALSTFVDGIVRQHSHWIAVIVSLLAAGVLVYLLSLLKHRFLGRLAIRTSVKGYDRGLSRLLRLPVDFYEHRLVGDLTDRISSIDRISKNLTTQFLVVFVDVTMSVVLLVAMFVFDIVLTLFVLFLSVVYILFDLLLRKTRAVRTQAMRREQGLLIGVGMQMLNHADNLRMTGSDDRFFSRWSGQQARELQARHSLSELNSLSGAIPEFIGGLRTAAVLALGGILVLNGQMTLGTLVGFWILSEMFLEPIGRFLLFSDRRQAIETDLQRLDDIEKTPEDRIFRRQSGDSASIPTFNGKLQLTGHIELRGVTFGYNKSRPPLITDFNLTIKPGQRVAVVGPSGSGKSTLARLVAGISYPWSGDILYDGHPRNEIPMEVLRRSISMVDQQAILFSATVRDNITLWNSAVPDDIAIEAARDACIHDEILIRPQGYATIVEEGGVNFSGGQRQRLEIARALASNPTMLILDEATSALDAATEEAVDDGLRRRGVTCLIVAHRLSAVRDCDEIVVLNKGIVEQRGTHDELIDERDGTYFKLVKSG